MNQVSILSQVSVVTTGQGKQAVELQPGMPSSCNLCSGCSLTNCFG